MEVILLEEVNKLGKFGDTVKVAAGYGRNYLLPQGKAIIVNDDNREYFNQQRERLQQAAQEKLEGIEKIAAALEGVTIKIAAKTTSSEGKLYGSVAAADVADNLKDKHKVELDKKYISVPNAHIRQTGEYKVKITLDNEQVLHLPLHVIAA